MDKREVAKIRAMFVKIKELYILSYNLFKLDIAKRRERYIMVFYIMFIYFKLFIKLIYICGRI